MSCCYRLRLNGVWVPFHVHSGVGVAFDRASDETVSPGGVRRINRARRAPRTWSFNLGDLTGPEQVAALMTAAQSDGELMLWDEAAARANMLDPVALLERPGYPVVDCGGVPLRSLTQGPVAPTVTVDVPLKANMAIQPGGASGPGVSAEPGSFESLVKVSVPDAPASMTLASATLMLRETAGNAGTLTAYATSNAWVEVIGTTDYWTNVPAGASRGSAAIAPTTSVALSGVAAFAGTDMSVRLVKTSGSGWSVFRDRTNGANPPVLRLTYSALSTPRTFTQHVPADIAQTLSFWTDAPDGTVFGTLKIPSGTVLNLTVPATGATGLRHVVQTLAAPGYDFDGEWTINDSSAYVLAGLGLSSMVPGAYSAPHKTPARVVVDDPTLTLDTLYAGEQGTGQRTVTIREVGT